MRGELSSLLPLDGLEEVEVVVPEDEDVSQLLSQSGWPAQPLLQAAGSQAADSAQMAGALGHPRRRRSWQRQRCEGTSSSSLTRCRQRGPLGSRRGWGVRQGGLGLWTFGAASGRRQMHPSRRLLRLPGQRRRGRPPRRRRCPLRWRYPHSLPQQCRCSRLLSKGCPRRRWCQWSRMDCRRVRI